MSIPMSCRSSNCYSLLGCRSSNSSDLELQIVAGRQNQAILGCRSSTLSEFKLQIFNSNDFGLQIVKLKRFWVADRRNSSHSRLQIVKLKRFWVAGRQTQAILGCRSSNSNDFGLQIVKPQAIPKNETESTPAENHDVLLQRLGNDPLPPR